MSKKILAIETSCDETGVSILECEGGLENASFTVLGDALYSQAEKHAEFGGVFPTLAKREHQANLAPLTTEALRQAGMLKTANKKTGEKNRIIYDTISGARDEEFKKTIGTFLETYEKPEIDFIAVTKGPGLEPALWTGITFAEALASAWGLPVAGIDHMEGHVVSALLRSAETADQTRMNAEGRRTDSSLPVRYTLTTVHLPLLSLLVSGGHTELVVMREWFDYEVVGETRDDAVGEAFDKVARLLDLSYPGGPKIAELAERSRNRADNTQPNAEKLPHESASSPHKSAFTFPRPMMNDATCDFSFSGLKTAVLYKLKSLDKISEDDKENIAAEFENAARDVIVEKTRRALKATDAKTLAVGGGVSANKEIRAALEKLVKESFDTVPTYFPHGELTGDNAIMIGAAAYLRHTAGALQFETGITASGVLRRSKKIARG